MGLTHLSMMMLKIVAQEQRSEYVELTQFVFSAPTVD